MPVVTIALATGDGAGLLGGRTEIHEPRFGVDPA